MSLISFIVYGQILKFTNYILYIANFVGNVPSMIIVGTYYFVCETVFHRFSYINLLLEQFAYKSLDRDGFQVVKKRKYYGGNRDPNHIPRIMVDEVYLEGRSSKIKEDFEDEKFSQEMKKFTNDLDKKERSNFLTEFWRSVTKM
jgi:hypothetical protein